MHEVPKAGWLVDRRRSLREPFLGSGRLGLLFACWRGLDRELTERRSGEKPAGTGAAE